jgi:uncharacterized protein YbaR (Trm112 family)
MAAPAAAAVVVVEPAPPTRKRKDAPAADWNVVRAGLADLEESHPARCPICFAVMVDPYVTPCDHVFCGNCLKTAVRTRKACPIDRNALASDGSTIRPLREANPLAYRQTFGALKVRCPLHVPDGCAWIGDYTSMHDHLNTTCLLHPVACPHCKLDIARGLVDQHKNDACDMRPVHCEHCKRFFTFRRMEDHVALACKSVLVQCRGREASRTAVVRAGEAKVAVEDIKHDDDEDDKDDKDDKGDMGCGARIKRGSMKRHWRDDCPKSRVKCPLASRQCDWDGRRDQVEEHCTRDAVKHVKLLSTAVSRLEGEMVARGTLSAFPSPLASEQAMETLLKRTSS